MSKAVRQDLYNHAEHGDHNRKFVQFISETSKEFPDWVVTGAFYASMHKVYSVLFPDSYDLLDCHNKQKHFDSFEEYWRRQKKAYPEGKHSCTAILVKEKLNNISDAFNELKDLCWISRYRNYKTSLDDVDIAKKAMNEIFEYCENF